MVNEKNVTSREDIMVEKHGLKIPVGAQNYEEFVEEMKEREQIFCEELFA